MTPTTNQNMRTTQDKLYEANIRIKRLEVDVRQLSEPFVAMAYLQTAEHDIPLIVEIDPVEKVIMSIQIHKTTSI